MASNEPFFLVFVPSSIQFPNWIGLTCVTRILWKWSGVTSRTKSYEALWLLLALSQIDSLWWKPAVPVLGTLQQSYREVFGSDRPRSPTTCQPWAWVTLELDLPASVRSADDCSLHPHHELQPREIPTQLSCSPAPDTQTLHEIMFGMTLSF